MKWYGKIGYREVVQTEPGIWEEKIVEKEKKGNLIRVKRSLQSSGQVNDNVRIVDVISIVADPYASLNMYNMLYVTVNGAKWKVADVTIASYPRMELTMGGLYNEG